MLQYCFALKKQNLKIQLLEEKLFVRLFSWNIWTRRIIPPACKQQYEAKGSSLLALLNINSGGNPRFVYPNSYTVLLVL